MARRGATGRWWKRSDIEVNPPEQILQIGESRFTGLGKQFQFVESSISKVDMPSALEKPLQC